MNTGEITNWAGNPQEIGAMYPFVGAEVFMVVLLILFWSIWTIWQFKSEGAALEEEAQALRSSVQVALTARTPVSSSRK